MGMQDTVFDVTADVEKYCPPETAKLLEEMVSYMWLLEEAYEVKTEEMAKFKEAMRVMEKLCENVP